MYWHNLCLTQEIYRCFVLVTVHTIEMEMIQVVCFSQYLQLFGEITPNYWFMRGWLLCSELSSLLVCSIVGTVWLLFCVVVESLVSLHCQSLSIHSSMVRTTCSCTLEAKLPFEVFWIICEWLCSYACIGLGLMCGHVNATPRHEMIVVCHQTTSQWVDPLGSSKL